MKLKVPLIQQQEKSYHCQVATTSMILAYYKDSMLYNEVLSSLEPYLVDTGMHSQGPALFLKQRGYEVFFAHHDLNVIDPSIENCDENDLEKITTALASIEDTEKNSYRIKKLNLDIEFIKKGGKYSTKLPNLELIDFYLDQNIPVVLSAIRYKGIRLNPRDNDNNHAVVIVGKEDDNYLINDPAPISKGEYAVSSDRLLHAWYKSGAQLLAVWKLILT